MKLDYSGDTVWTQEIWRSEPGLRVKVIETSDGGYLIAGRTYVTAVPEDSDPGRSRRTRTGIRSGQGNMAEMMKTILTASSRLLMDIFSAVLPGLSDRESIPSMP